MLAFILTGLIPYIIIVLNFNVVELEEAGTQRRQLIFLGGPKELTPDYKGVGLCSHCQGYSVPAHRPVCIRLRDCLLCLKEHWGEEIPIRKDWDTENLPQTVPGALQRVPSCPACIFPQNRAVHVCLVLPSLSPRSFPSYLSSFAISSSCSSLVLCSSSYLHSIYMLMSPALELPPWDTGMGVDKPRREMGHRVTCGQQRENWWRNVWSFLWVDSSTARSVLQSSSEVNSRTAPQVPPNGD